MNVLFPTAEVIQRTNHRRVPRGGSTSTDELWTKRGNLLGTCSIGMVGELGRLAPRHTDEIDGMVFLFEGTLRGCWRRQAAGDGWRASNGRSICRVRLLDAVGAGRLPRDDIRGLVEKRLWRFYADSLP